MHTRYMERTNSMKGGGKRSLEGGDDEEQEPDRKRPALARYIDQGMEGLMKSIQHQLHQKEQQIAATRAKLSSQERERDALIQMLKLMSATAGITDDSTTAAPEAAKPAAPAAPKEKLSPEASSSAKKPAKWSELAEIDEQVAQATKQKNWYVIFDGPFRGIYNDWAIASQHITGKRVTHKSYSSKEEANEALNPSYKNVLKTQAKGKDKMVTLGQIKIPIADRVKGVMSVNQKQEQKMVTFEKFQ